MLTKTHILFYVGDNLIQFNFLVCFFATPAYAQDLLLALCLGFTPGKVISLCLEIFVCFSWIILGKCFGFVFKILSLVPMLIYLFWSGECGSVGLDHTLPSSGVTPRYA